MLDLEITDAAKLDIEDIFEYTLNFFGEKKANEYSFDLYINIEMLQRNPEIGHYRNDIPLGFLAWSFEQHIIIYETWEIAFL